MPGGSWAWLSEDDAPVWPLPNVVVDNAVVQASGLLKDIIILDLPAETGSFAMTLARDAAKAVREASRLWHDYAQQENMAEPVRPLLVVQVPNKPSVSEVAALLDAIYDAWPDLGDDAVANVFGEHTDETYGRHAVPYIAPQNVQEATHVRVLWPKTPSPRAGIARGQRRWCLCGQLRTAPISPSYWVGWCEPPWLGVSTQTSASMP